MHVFCQYGELSCLKLGWWSAGQPFACGCAAVFLGEGDGCRVCFLVAFTAAFAVCGSLGRGSSLVILRKQWLIIQS